METIISLSEKHIVTVQGADGNVDMLEFASRIDAVAYLEEILHAARMNHLTVRVLSDGRYKIQGD